MKLKIFPAVLLASAVFTGTASAHDAFPHASTSTGFLRRRQTSVGRGIQPASGWEPGTVYPARSSRCWNESCVLQSKLPQQRHLHRRCADRLQLSTASRVWALWIGLREFLSGKSRNRTYNYTGASPPPDGLYTFSGKTTPNGFAILGPRIGVWGRQYHWLPYFRIGKSFHQRDNAGIRPLPSRTPPGTASFTLRYKDLTPVASVMGVGVRMIPQIQSPWSIRAEYTHISLGKGDNTVTSCSGNATTCARYGNISLDNIHNSLTANIPPGGLQLKQF